MNSALALRAPPSDSVAHPINAVDSVGAIATITPRWTPSDPREWANADALAPRAIHLWAIDLSQLSLQPDGSHFALLSDRERARADRIRMDAPRAMYLGGRIGLRLLLAAYTGLHNDQLHFAAGARGKPSLRNPLRGGELCFNYSLSRGHALYALAWNRQIGIDLEAQPRRINAQRLAARKLTADERRAWHALPPRERERAMLACWTRKEAYGKALGVGIRFHLNRAPLCRDLAAPTWRCRVRGLFDADTDTEASDTRELHGVQIAPPFDGIAALMHDGDALESPDDGATLQGWRWRAGDAR